MTCSPPSSTKFPPEVIEHVIDALHSNVPALRQFAVTCRALLPRSRYHLFYAIRFQPTQKDVHSLCRFLDAYPPLAAIVHIATVCPPRCFRPTESFAEVFPAELLKRLPQLRHFKLFTGATKLSEAPRAFHPATLALLRTTIALETLEIKDLSFTSNTELARLLTSLPLLRALRCSKVQVKLQYATATTAGGPAQPRPHRSLRTLCFAGGVQTSLLRFLIEFSSATLEELQLGYSQICVDDGLDVKRLGHISLRSLASLTFFDQEISVEWGVARRFVQTTIQSIHSPSLKCLRLANNDRVQVFVTIPARDCQECHPFLACRCGSGMCAVVSTLNFEELDNFPPKSLPTTNYHNLDIDGGYDSHGRNADEYSTSTSPPEKQCGGSEGFHLIHCACVKEIGVIYEVAGHVPLPLPFCDIECTLGDASKQDFSRLPEHGTPAFPSTTWPVKMAILLQFGPGKKVPTLEETSDHGEGREEATVEGPPRVSCGTRDEEEKREDPFPYTLDDIHLRRIDLVSKMSAGLTPLRLDEARTSYCTDRYIKFLSSVRLLVLCHSGSLCRFVVS